MRLKTRRKVLSFGLVVFSSIAIANPNILVAPGAPLNLKNLESGLREADALVMDITPGSPWPSVDSDRAFTLGLAYGLKKPIYLYTHADKKFDARVIEAFTKVGRTDFVREPHFYKRLLDPDRYALEEFGLWDNLMLEGAAHAEVFRSLGQTFDFIYNHALPEIEYPGLKDSYYGSNVYLAGPDVFLEFPLFSADAKKELLARLGFVGKFPLDNEIAVTEPRAMATQIFKANIQLMMNSGSVIFNLTPFRGPDVDPGTAFEVGFMYAHERDLFAYVNKPLKGAALIRAALKAQGRRVEGRFGMAAGQLFLHRQDWKRFERRQDFCKNTLAAKSR